MGLFGMRRAQVAGGVPGTHPCSIPLFFSNSPLSDVFSPPPQIPSPYPSLALYHHLLLIMSLRSSLRRRDVGDAPSEISEMTRTVARTVERERPRTTRSRKSTRFSTALSLLVLLPLYLYIPWWTRREHMRLPEPKTELYVSFFSVSTPVG